MQCFLQKLSENHSLVFESTAVIDDYFQIGIFMVDERGNVYEIVIK